ncbi:hypothetical protein ACPOLB_10945 [Rubrivivax sp. RP6-9]|uniref:hypothetical protein n=1 Tax=Rubrivivax sp. RP6-9 TaxID=3415750 RepID=UPI003CC5795A
MTAAADPAARRAALEKRAALALGAAVVCVLFGIETSVAHHIAPNPASPLVWTGLALAGSAALAVWAWSRLQLRRLRQAPDGGP